MSEEFVSEPITPCKDGGGSAGMVPAGPVVPKRFEWRGRTYEVAEVVRVWKQDGPMKGGGPEMYLRKHWFELRTTDGLTMKIYFERQARSRAQQKKRWWLYTVSTSPSDPPDTVGQDA